MDTNNIFLGTEIKLNIHIEPIGDMRMEDYDFHIELYCSSRKSQIIEKKDAKRVDADNFIVFVDSDMVGTGEVKCKITAYIPDADFDDLLRTEVMIIDTGINITKSLA